MQLARPIRGEHIENMRQKHMTGGGRKKFDNDTNNKEETEHEKRHNERDKKMAAGGRIKLLGKGGSGKRK